MTYNIIINIGKKRMTDYLSSTLLFPFLEKKYDKNLFFYFWKYEYQKEPDWKLDKIYQEIKILLKKGHQTFNLIYFVSDYNILLENEISESNSIFFYYNKIKSLKERFDPEAKKYTNFNHLLLFQSPWYREDDISLHVKFFKKVITDIEQPYENEKSIKSGNTIYTRCFNHSGRNLQTFSFNHMSLKGIGLILHILNEQLKQNDWFLDNVKSKCKDETIHSFNVENYNKYLGEYKSRLKILEEKLCEKTVDFEIDIFENETKFWALDSSSDESEEEKPTSYKIKDIVNEINVDNFNNKWAEIVKYITEETKTSLLNIKSAFKIKQTIDTIVPEANNKKTEKIKPESKETPAEFIEDLIVECKKSIKGIDLYNNISFSDLSVRSLSTNLKNKIDLKRGIIFSAVRKVPYKKYGNLIYVITAIFTFIPLLSLIFFYVYFNVNIISLVYFSSGLFISLVLIILIKAKLAKQKLFKLVKLLFETQKGTVSDFYNNISNQRKKEIDKMNIHKTNMINLRLLNQELSELRKNEDEKSKREALIKNILENNDLLISENSKKTKINKDDIQTENFHSEICFLTHDQLTELFT